ncbi:hypothetical protein VNO77_38992 [Canavalia gladiata]|uniref:Uncharacterized protein n=1 Tax=Canavalia gladiata TaxID=3824 RepID=A0AAN9PWQ6_CANGL
MQVIARCISSLEWAYFRIVFGHGRISNCGGVHDAASRLRRLSPSLSLSYHRSQGESRREKKKSPKKPSSPKSEKSPLKKEIHPY